MATENVSTPTSATELRSFVLPSARSKGNTLGKGAYGTVEEYDVDGIPCAGKRIYDVLAQFGARDIVPRYVEECKLMTKLRHSNIVQFLGVCFPSESALPVLIMERLTTDLDSLLENTPNIPLSLRMSFLTDVAQGLAYLHGHRPPIIHRDLSAKNVLLNSSLVAKISDLGNSRIVTLSPEEVARLSFTPGTFVYMPPEMSEGSSCYGPSLDIFSVGHLGLFTATQVFPKDLLLPNYTDPTSQRRLIGRSEVERRERYFIQLHKQLGEDHDLVKVIMECLDNDPHQRPTAEQLVSRLEEIGLEVQSPQDHTAKLQLMRQLRQIEDSELTQLRQQLDSLQFPKQGERENSIEPLHQELRDAHQSERHSLLDPANAGKFNIRQCANIPMATSHAQAVVIRGNVYVGGGVQSSQNIFIYNIMEDVWSSIESYTYWFALAAYNKHLVLVGGWASLEVTDQLWVLGEDDHWQQPIPPMPTPRERASAVGYGQHLIVAGGMSKSNDVLNTVEVYSGQQWIEADPMPRGFLFMKSTVLSGTWYLTGGAYGMGKITANSDGTVLSVSLQSLTERAASTQRNGPSPWNKPILKNTPNKLMAIATTGGGLVAFGGYKTFKSRSYAYMYFPHTKSWVSIGELPNFLFSTCAITLPNGEVVLCGGRSSEDEPVDTVYAMKVWD